MKKSLVAVFAFASLVSANPAEAACPNAGLVKVAAVCGTIAAAAIGYGAREAYKDEQFFLNCRPEPNQNDLQRFPRKFTNDGEIAPEFLNQPRCADALQVLGHFGGSSNHKIVVAGVIGGPFLITTMLSLAAYGIKTCVVDRMSNRKHQKL